MPCIDVYVVLCLFKLCSTAVHNWNCTFYSPERNETKKFVGIICLLSLFLTINKDKKKPSLDVEHHCYRIINFKKQTNLKIHKKM